MGEQARDTALQEDSGVPRRQVSGFALDAAVPVLRAWFSPTFHLPDDMQVLCKTEAVRNYHKLQAVWDVVFF